MDVITTLILIVFCIWIVLFVYYSIKDYNRLRKRTNKEKYKYYLSKEQYEEYLEASKSLDEYAK